MLTKNSFRAASN